MSNPKFRIWNKQKNSWEVKDFHLIGEVMLLEGFPLSELNNLEINQYTGLKDKNGKEIYEGDIVRDSRTEESEAVIEYCQPIAAFVARPIIRAPYDVYQLNEGNTMGSLKLSYTEVIGNIYENPDLLKGEPNE